MKLNKKVLTGALALAMGLGVAAPAVNSFAEEMKSGKSGHEIMSDDYKKAEKAFVALFNKNQKLKASIPAEEKSVVEKIKAQLKVNKGKLAAANGVKEYMPESYKLYKDRIDTAIDNAEKAIKQAEDFLKDKDKEKEDKTKEEDNKELSIDDEWVVDGLAKLKINSVKQFDERNEYADFDPAQGILIDYTYENLGYRVNDADLFFEPNSVIDGEGTMGEIYPASFDISYAQDVPIGAKVENAQVTYGLKHESNEVKIMFSLYDVNNEEHRVTFKVPVEK